mmetsp:Transcript_21172/g.86467  ORF Transcript_21172/g.86467 Transcript_21172/m.86467 type:complete len:100 (+) Transcript_21172:2037-2336(+)
MLSCRAVHLAIIQASNGKELRLFRRMQGSNVSCLTSAKSGRIQIFRVCSSASPVLQRYRSSSAQCEDLERRMAKDSGSDSYRKVTLPFRFLRVGSIVLD